MATYLSILLQSCVLRKPFDAKAIFSQCLEMFNPFIFMCFYYHHAIIVQCIFVSNSFYNGNFASLEMFFMECVVHYNL